MQAIEKVIRTAQKCSDSLRIRERGEDHERCAAILGPSLVPRAGMVHYKGCRRCSNRGSAMLVVNVVPM